MKQMSRQELQCFLEFAPHYFRYINKALDEQVSCSHVTRWRHSFTLYLSPHSLSFLSQLLRLLLTNCGCCTIVKKNIYCYAFWFCVYYGIFLWKALFSLRRKHKHNHNDSEDAYGTSISTWACAEWTIALYSGPCLFDTVKQNGGQCLCLQRCAPTWHKYKSKRKKNKYFFLLSF